MHRLLYVHSSFVRSVVVSYIFLCTPDNSMMQYLFHWLFLQSDSGTTENMFHIQPYCPGTPAFCMYNTLGWWQLFERMLVWAERFDHGNCSIFSFSSHFTKCSHIADC